MAAYAILRRAVAQKFLSRSFSAHVDPKQAAAALKLWRNLSLIAVPIALGLGLLNVYLNEEEHEPPEFIPYEHLRIRNKRFPWGDGNHTLFHNPRVNALPTGYEDH